MPRSGEGKFSDGKVANLAYFTAGGKEFYRDWL
jgi:hypothetical protein